MRYDRLDTSPPVPNTLEVEGRSVAAPHERWAKLAKRLHDTEHAGDDTTSVGEPDEGGGQDETASIDDGVLVVSCRKAAPMLERG